jgi:hypothetical protein
VSNVTSGALSTYCYDSMWDYYRTPEDEVGSEFQGPRRNRARTNCIVYVYNVLKYGHTKLGRADVVRQLNAISPRESGMELARYLVGQSWKAHYWNPDVYKPRDGDGEHTETFTQALATYQYYDVRLSGMIVGYNKQQKFRTEGPPWYWPFGDSVKVSTEDPENLKVFDRLTKVKFAVCLARGAKHCFLLSYGDVFEVHWDQEGPRLYGRRKLYGYDWNSGIILTPPDSSFASRSVAALKAKT